MSWATGGFPARFAGWARAEETRRWAVSCPLWRRGGGNRPSRGAGEGSSVCGSRPGRPREIGSPVPFTAPRCLRAWTSRVLQEGANPPGPRESRSDVLWERTENRGGLQSFPSPVLGVHRRGQRNPTRVSSFQGSRLQPEFCGCCLWHMVPEYQSERLRPFISTRAFPVKLPFMLGLAYWFRRPRGQVFVAASS